MEGGKREEGGEGGSEKGGEGGRREEAVYCSCFSLMLLGPEISLQIL